jgi:hypothetical protein
MATQQQREKRAPSGRFSLNGGAGYVSGPITDRGRGQLVHTSLRYPRSSAQTRSNAGEGIADSVSRRELPVTFVPHHDSAWLAETAIAAVGVTAALILLISACLCERSWTTVALMGATALCNPATRVGIRRVRRRAQPTDPAWTAA